MGQTYPLPMPSVAPANPHAGKPRAIAADWLQGQGGEATGVNRASLAVKGINNDTVAAYGPRNQAEKAAMPNLNPGTVMVEDVARPAGWIDPHQPYAAKPASPAGDPVVSSISPTTAPAAQLPLTVTITGTGFTPWSTVYTGGAVSPEAEAVYISPTQMKVPLWAAQAGTVSVAVRDHGVMSNTDVLFTVT